VKRYKLTLPAKILIVAAIFAAVLIIENARGIFPKQGSSLLLSEDSVRQYGESFSLTIGAQRTEEIASIIAANGGLQTAKESLVAKSGQTVSVKIFPDRKSIERAFTRGTIQIMATTPSRFASLAASLQNITPVAFLLTAPSSENIVLASKLRLTSGADFAGKTIVCTRNSSAFFLARYIAYLSSNEDKIKWIHTGNDSEAAALFSKGKADIIALDALKEPVPKDAAVILSTETAAALFSTVLVTREADIALHEEAYRALVKTHFDNRKIIASKKEPDARTLLASFDIKMREGKHPSARICSESDNALFFRLTPQRRWDYASQYMLGLRPSPSLGSDNDILSAETINTLILNTVIQPGAVRIDPVASENTPSAAPFVLSAKQFSFSKDNSDIERTSRTLFRESAILLTALPRAVISASLGGETPEERNTFYQREQVLRNHLTQLYGIPSSRIIIVKGKEPFFSVLLP
jgi:hypothetical protein